MLVCVGNIVMQITTKVIVYFFSGKFDDVFFSVIHFSSYFIKIKCMSFS